MKKLFSLLLAVCLLLSCVPITAFADGNNTVSEFAYEENSVDFIKNTVNAETQLFDRFSMLAAQDGSTATISGDDVLIHIIPKNTTTYSGIHFVTSDNTDLSVDATIKNGAIDIKLPKTQCGYAWPVVAIKVKDGTASSQFYLAIPAEDKLPVAKPTYKITFQDEDGSELAVIDVEENAMPVFPGEAPTKEEDEDFTYTLAWSPKLAKATKDTTYKVTFTKTEKVVKEFAYSGDSVNFINIDGEGFGMFTPQDGTTAVIDGDNVVIHYVPKNKTVYNGIYYGKAADANDHPESIEKNVTANDDGSFDITLPKTQCGYAWPAAPIKASDGKSTAGQYYLAIPAEEKLSEETPANPGTDPGTNPGTTPGSDTPADKTVELTVDNQVKMFKVIDAKLVTKEGETTLEVTLNGSGYHYLYKGTYDDAAKVGYKPAKWIEGELNKDSKYVFSIPVDEDETYIPIVSISQTYVDKHVAGECKITRAFFPRQFTLDAKKKTLLVEDYSYTQSLKVSNKTGLDISKASMTTVGGPNSNDYASTLKLSMKSDTYTKAFFGTAKKAASSNKTVSVGSSDTFSLKVRWVETQGDPDSVESYVGDWTTMAFYNASEKIWEEFEIQIDEKKSTLTVAADEDAEPVAADPESQNPEDGEGAAGTFKDVKSGDWFEDYANKAAELGLMTGYAAGTDAEGNAEYEFRGSNKVTRAMFVTILSAMNTKLKGESEPAPSAGFADVKPGAWYEKAVDWAYASGITAGRGTGFGVDDNVTRQDMAVFLYIYAKNIGKVEGTPDTSVLDKYGDAADIAGYAKEAMAWLVSNGLMTGRSETSLAPLAESTRAEIAAFAVSCYNFLAQ